MSAPELHPIAEMARAAGWTWDPIGPDAIAIALPDGGTLVVYRRPSGRWNAIVAVDVGALDAVDAADAASLIAGALADRAVWPLHQTIDLEDAA